MNILDLGLNEAMRAVTRLRYFFIRTRDVYTKYYSITQWLGKNLGSPELAVIFLSN